MTPVINVIIAAAVISFTAWLSGRYPVTAGFIVAMPIATLLVLPMGYLQHGDPGQTTLMARSIFFAVPVSLAFFVPFLLAERLHLGFWPTYGMACAILPVGFFVHRAVLRLF